MVKVNDHLRRVPLGKTKHFPASVFNLPISSQIPRHELHGNSLERIFRRWWSTNHATYRLLIVKGKISGFTCVIPLTSDAYVEYTTGGLSEWDISEKHFLTEPQPELLTPCYVLIQSITISDGPGRSDFLEACRKGRAAPWRISLIRTLIRHIADVVIYRQFEMLTLIADGTIEGERLLRKLGFKEVTRNNLDGRPIFEISNKIIEGLPRNSPPRRLLIKLKSIYEYYCNNRKQEPLSIGK